MSPERQPAGTPPDLLGLQEAPLVRDQPTELRGSVLKGCFWKRLFFPNQQTTFLSSAALPHRRICPNLLPPTKSCVPLVGVASSRGHLGIPEGGGPPRSPGDHAGTRGAHVPGPTPLASTTFTAAQARSHLLSCSGMAEGKWLPSARCPRAFEPG